jgi:hypothetical protein
MTASPWYFDPVFLPAAFGLIGVIIGAGIAAGASFLLDERREQRAVLKEERRRRREIQTAARLIELDLRRGYATTETSIKTKKWITSPARPISLDNWEKFRDVIAAELCQDDWIKVVLAFHNLEHVNGWREPARLAEKHGPISDAVIAGLEKFVVTFREGQTVLDRLMDDSKSMVPSEESAESG